MSRIRRALAHATFPRGFPTFKRTVTGASTRCTLLSSTRISFALVHSALTSASLISSCFQRESFVRHHSGVFGFISPNLGYVRIGEAFQSACPDLMPWWMELLVTKSVRILLQPPALSRSVTHREKRVNLFFAQSGVQPEWTTRTPCEQRSTLVILPSATLG